MDTERLDTLVLLRLATVARPTPSLVLKSLRPLTNDNGAPLGDAIEQSIARLRARGDVAQGRPLRVTEAGLARAREWCGGPPQGARWSLLLRRRVLPLALGLGPEKAALVTTADDLKSVLIAAKLGLEPRPKNAFLDGLVWRALGMSDERPLSLERLRARVLAQSLDRPLGDVALERALSILAATAVGSPRSEPAALVESALRRWVSAPRAASPPVVALDVPGPPSTLFAETPDLSIEEFARLILDIARDSRVHRATPDKAFIASVWDAASARGALAGWNERRFTAALLAAHRARLLELARADLIQTMNPDDVERSRLETAEGATYHCVRTDGGRT